LNVSRNALLENPVKRSLFLITLKFEGAAIDYLEQIPQHGLKCSQLVHITLKLFSQLDITKRRKGAKRHIF
jgi:hypothetical protein